MWKELLSTLLTKHINHRQYYITSNWSFHYLIGIINQIIDRGRGRELTAAVIVISFLSSLIVITNSLCQVLLCYYHLIDRDHPLPVSSSFPSSLPSSWSDWKWNIPLNELLNVIWFIYSPRHAVQQKIAIVFQISNLWEQGYEIHTLPNSSSSTSFPYFFDSP